MHKAIKRMVKIGGMFLMTKKNFVFVASFLTMLVVNTAWADIASTSYVTTGLSDKQDKLKAGSNITIANDGTISAKDTTYSAGTNISLSGTTFNVATGTPSKLGVVKVGQIPSGSATSETYATIWVE